MPSRQSTGRPPLIFPFLFGLLGSIGFLTSILALSSGLAEFFFAMTGVLGGILGIIAGLAYRRESRMAKPSMLWFAVLSELFVGFLFLLDPEIGRNHTVLLLFLLYAVSVALIASLGAWQLRRPRTA
jgi:hypothetical protein